jgi:hypothetical protein
MGSRGVLRLVVGVYLTLRDGMKSEYLSCPWNTSLGEWYKKWFYIREESNTATLCDVGYVPEKRERAAIVHRVGEGTHGATPIEPSRRSGRSWELH